MTRSIIYEVLDEVRTMVGGMLKPIYEEEVLGHAEVRKTFSISRIGTVAGCMVTDGVIRRNAKARIVRDGRVVYDSGIASLKHFDQDEREVKSGFECGISIERFNDIKVGDVVESYTIHERQATI
jgi:translation initiation factor IF-2